MNIQEAIQELHNLAFTNLNAIPERLKLDDAVRIVNQIDEPQKVVIPVFIAEWLEECKSVRNIALGQAIEHVDSRQQEEIFDWFWGIGYRDNQLRFARAWLDGYEVEQEKLYTVEIPNPNFDEYSIIVGWLAGRIGIKHICNKTWKTDINNHLTEEEIKKDFDWVWQWAKPVEEVSDKYDGF